MKQKKNKFKNKNQMDKKYIKYIYFKYCEKNFVKFIQHSIMNFRH